MSGALSSAFFHHLCFPRCSCVDTHNVIGVTPLLSSALHHCPLYTPLKLFFFAVNFLGGWVGVYVSSQCCRVAAEPWVRTLPFNPSPHTHTHTRLQISPLSGHRYLFSCLSGFGVVPMGCVLRRKGFFLPFCHLNSHVLLIALLPDGGDGPSDSDLCS